MKRIPKKISAILMTLLIALQIPCFSVITNADVEVTYNSPTPHNYDVTWFSPSGVTGTVKGIREFTVQTSVNGMATSLYISFPIEGGFRLRSKTFGIYTPSSRNEIVYTSLSGGILKMTAKNSDTVLYFNTINSTSWKIEAYNKQEQKVLTVNNNQIFFGYDEQNVLQKIKFEAPLGTKEILYGTGERFNGLNQVGKTLQLWNADSAYHDTYNDNNYNPDNIKNHIFSYANVPLLHSSNGYSLFFNSTYCCEADLGNTDTSKYSLDFYGPVCDIYVWTDSAEENISQYLKLTGAPYVPPKWALGYWCGAGEFVWKTANGGYKQKLIDIMERYADIGVRPAALYGEWYPAEDKSCYDILENYGTRMLTYNYPNNRINICGTDYDIEYDGKVPFTTGDYFIDYTAPNIEDYLSKFYNKYWQWGLGGVMLDVGDIIHENVSFSNGMANGAMHNYYAYHYAKAFNDTFSKKLGNDFILFSRSVCSGSQAYTACFSGDQASRWYGMKEQLNSLLSLSTSGFSAWGGDIGGVWGYPTSELYTRWAEFAAFTPLMRAHGSPVFRDPWEFGEDAVKGFVKNYCYRENLIDTIYSACIRANKEGVTAVEPMIVAFPQDSQLMNCEDQYIFCKDLLVAPILSDGARSRSVALPSGTWYNLNTGESVSGGTAVTAQAPIDVIPVYLRQGMASPIKLAADTLTLGDSMYNKETVDALLVTPADSERISTQYESETVSRVYTNTKTSGGFTLTASEPDRTSTLTVYGFKAQKITVDGKSLTQYNNLSSLTENEGYWTSNDGNRTVVKLSGANWEQIEFLKFDNTPKTNVSFNSTSIMASHFSSTFATEANTPYRADGAGFNPIDINEKWTAESGILTRKNDDGGYTNNVAMLTFTDKVYTDFELNIDYRQDSANWFWPMIGFGASKAGEFATDNPGNAVAYCSQEGKPSFWCNGLECGPTIDSTNQFGTIAGYDNANNPVWHHLKLVVKEDTAKLYIDDAPPVTATNFHYNGGYIYIAAGANAASFKSLIIKDLSSENKPDSLTKSFDSFVCTYANEGDILKRADLSADRFYPVAASEKWELSNNSFVRKAESADLETGNMAQLTFTDRKYKNFVLDVDYYQSPKTWKWAMVGFGASNTGEFVGESGNNIAAYLEQEGASILWGTGLLNRNADNRVIERMNGYPLNTSLAQWHHLKIVVYGNTVKTYVDYSTKSVTGIIPQSYNGGYIYLAAGCNEARFKNLTVKELSDDCVSFGDANSDGKADILDLIRLKRYLTEVPGAALNVKAVDFDFDGLILSEDFAALKKFFIL